MTAGQSGAYPEVTIWNMPLTVVNAHAHFDIVPFKEYEVVGVPDGYIFDLGDGHEIELVFLPGHTCGHAGFLDKKERIFSCSDDACFGAVGIGGSRPDNPHAKYASVEGLYNELVKITARMRETLLSYISSTRARYCNASAR